jgi:GNAT superfamily N-acetyltransferase
MEAPICVRPIERNDYEQWRPLWDAYNAFYGRTGATALPEQITATTWERFFAETEAVHARVAVRGDRIVGLVHYLFHPSTRRLHDVCYLQDLYTLESERGRGIGRALILAVYQAAGAAGCERVYWHTQESNTNARALYDKVAEYKGAIAYSHEL